MKKWIFNVFLIGIITILIVGCTSVGATDTSTDSNNDENYVEGPSPQGAGHTNTGGSEGKQEKEGPDGDINKDGQEDEKDEDINNDKEDNIDENEEKSEDIPTGKKAKVYYSGDGKRKQVALTFDDGPESKYTQKILDILDEYNIKATFFVLGQNAAQHANVLKDINGRGHEIGSHSWSHKYLPKISKASKKNEILKTEKLLVDILGEYTPIFRPPYGAVKDQERQLLGDLGYKIVNWSVDTKDWAGTSGQQMMKYVQDQLKPGGIVLMHNTSNTKTVPNLIDILPTMIEWITEQGYEFVTVTEILK